MQVELDSPPDDGVSALRFASHADWLLVEQQIADRLRQPEREPARHALDVSEPIAHAHVDAEPLSIVHPELNAVAVCHGQLVG